MPAARTREHGVEQQHVAAEQPSLEHDADREPPGCRPRCGATVSSRPVSCGSTKYRATIASTTNTANPTSWRRGAGRAGADAPRASDRRPRARAGWGRRRRRRSSFTPRALASSACDRLAATRRTAGAARGAAPADGLRQREPGEQVDDVVLAEVDEREAERRGVGPAERARRRGRPRRARARPSRMSRSAARASRRADCLRGHRTAGPSGLPEVLAVLDHHAPQLRRAPSSVRPRAGRVPRRRRRHDPVDDQRRCRTRRRSGTRRAGSARGGAAAGRATVPCGTRNQNQCVQISARSMRVDAPGAARTRAAGAASAQRPRPSTRSTRDRVVDAHPPLERVGSSLGILYVAT